MNDSNNNPGSEGSLMAAPPLPPPAPQFMQHRPLPVQGIVGDSPFGFPRLAEVPTTTLFRTPGYNPFSVKISPFDGNLIVCMTSQNFGLRGAGRLFLFNKSTNSMIRTIDFRDGIFDGCWSECSPDICVVGGGDGRVQLIRINEGSVREVGRHAREITSLEWNQQRNECFSSTSWDGLIKVFNGPELKESVLRGHQGSVHQAIWSPFNSQVIASVSADRSLRLWDCRSQSHQITHVPDAHLGEIISLDWNKYQDLQICTAGLADNTLLFWDLRNPRQPFNRIPAAHRRSIKRVRWSPWNAGRLATVGYDMAVRFWNVAALNPIEAVWEEYSEFAAGLDWSNFERGVLASCSWDETVRLHLTNQ